MADVGVESTNDTEFVRLVSSELAAAYRLAGYILGSAADGEDAAQDAIERAFVSFDQLRDRTVFTSWFRRIVVNACRDRMRRRRRIAFVPVDAHDEDASLLATDPFALSLSRDALGRALDALPADERIVVVLHYWSDLSTAEIAGLLRIPQGTVKSKLHYAYRALRERLERDAREDRP